MRGNYRAPKRNGKYRASRHQRPKHPLVTLRIAVTVALAAVAVAGTLSADSLSASARTRPPIMVSASPDRSAADNLAGSTQSGLAYIFVATSLPIDAVSFVLDQGTDEEQRLTDDTAPYDLAGTAPDRTANPLDLTALADGSHKVVARLVDASGRTLARTSAVFSVVRPTQPEPTSTPTSTPDVDEHGHTYPDEHGHPYFDQYADAHQHDGSLRRRGDQCGTRRHRRRADQGQRRQPAR